MLLKTAAVPGKSIMGARSYLPCNGFFLFPVGRGRIAWLIRFVLALVRLPLSAGQNSHR